jgi:asparagine synthetase B (glutamine-hydrolysing)
MCILEGQRSEFREAHVKFVGIFLIPEKNHSFVSESLNLLFSNKNLEFFCDKDPFYGGAQGTFQAMFGELYRVLSSNESYKVSDELEGNFVRVSVDQNSNVTIETDPNCRLDIYYANTPNLKAFSNDQTLISRLLGDANELDQISLAHSLSIYGNRPPKKDTFHKNISRLGYKQKLAFRNGHLLVIDNKTFFANLNFKRNESDFLERYSKLFISAIEKRASDSQNIVFFSSGWDSTAITAALVKLKGAEKVKCLIGEMRYSTRSGVSNRFEIERARKICKHLNVELEITPFNYSVELPPHFGETIEFLRVNQLPSMTAANHYELARTASRFAEVGASVFAGEMSDGAHNLGFSQYVSIHHPSSLDFREYADKMRSYLFGPTFFELVAKKKVTDDPVWKFICEPSNIIYDVPEVETVARVRQFLTSFFLRKSRIPFSPQSELNFLTPLGATVYEDQMAEKYFVELEAFFEPRNLYALYLHLYNSFHWQGSTVNSLEISGNEFGLPISNPFHDNALINLLQEMPESYGRGLDFRPTKYPLKWTLENTLKYDLSLNYGLHSYTYDVDPTFSHTEELLFHSAFRETFRSALVSSQLIDQLRAEIFNKDYMRDLKHAYINNLPIKAERNTDLLTLCMHSLIL